MKVSFEGTSGELEELRRFLGGRSAVGDLPPPPPVPPAPGDLPGAGDYLRGRTITIDAAGNRTETDVLFLLPNPGGALGWDSIQKAMYRVPA